VQHMLFHTTNVLKEKFRLLRFSCYWHHYSCSEHNKRKGRIVHIFVQLKYRISRETENVRDNKLFHFEKYFHTL
jgi:hypothetical protein